MDLHSVEACVLKKNSQHRWHRKQYFSLWLSLGYEEPNKCSSTITTFLSKNVCLIRLLWNMDVCDFISLKNLPASMAFLAACLKSLTICGISSALNRRGGENSFSSVPLWLSWAGTGLSVHEIGAWPLGWKTATRNLYIKFQRWSRPCCFYFKPDHFRRWIRTGGCFSIQPSISGPPISAMDHLLWGHQPMVMLLLTGMWGVISSNV